MSLKMRSSFFTAMRTVIPKSTMIAIRNAHAFDPSCSNQLMVSNQNAHAFRPNSTVAKKRMPRSLVDAMTKTMSASWHNSVRHRFSASSASGPPRSCLIGFPFLGCQFLNGSSRVVMRMGRCQDISVGRNQRSLLWSSRTLPDWRMSYS